MYEINSSDFHLLLEALKWLQIRLQFPWNRSMILIVNYLGADTSSIIGATQEHLCSADLDEDDVDEDETKCTGVVDNSSDRNRATE